MGIEKDIQRLLAGVLEKHGGNKAAAAESLDVNPVTFWHWVTKTRNLPSTLCKAIDNAGGLLIVPGDSPQPLPNQLAEIERLREKVEYLSRENALLSKLVEKYELEEHEKKVSLGMDSSPREGKQVQSSGYGTRIKIEKLERNGQ